jgi:hypothetical protein
LKQERQYKFAGPKCLPEVISRRIPRRLPSIAVEVQEWRLTVLDATGKYSAHARPLQRILAVHQGSEKVLAAASLCRFGRASSHNRADGGVSAGAVYLLALLAQRTSRAGTGASANPRIDLFGDIEENRTGQLGVGLTLA